MQNAEVRLILKGSPTLLIGTEDTGSNGEAAFSVSQNGTYNAQITLSGYDYDNPLVIRYTTCPTQTIPAPQCNTSANCASTQLCDAGKCKQVPCECGKVANHICSPYECCANTDCTGGLVCQSNECVQKEECETDADCANTEYCSSGSCVPVTGECGYASNHMWTNYECCSDTGCAQGSHCTNNACVQNAYVLRLITESPMAVGEEATVALLSNGQRLPNTEIKVISPSGRVFSGYTDANGEFRFVPDAAGEYDIEALGLGERILASLPAAAAAGAAPLAASGGAVCSQLFGICWYWWVLLLIIVAGYIFYRRMSLKGKGPGKREPAGPKGQ